jgi:hypothetical protein
LTANGVSNAATTQGEKEKSLRVNSAMKKPTKQSFFHEFSSVCSLIELAHSKREAAEELDSFYAWCFSEWPAAALGKKGGQVKTAKGFSKMDPERRKEIAKAAAAKRWQRDQK